MAEAMPKKILDLMNVEKLTRENVASHLQVTKNFSCFLLLKWSFVFFIYIFKALFLSLWLQKFRLYLKRISGNQQAIMANSDLHFLQMSNGLDGFHHRPIPVGSGQFHGGAAAAGMRPFPPNNGILGRLNTPSGIGGVRNLSSPPSSGMFLQNPTDLGKFHHVSSLPLNHIDGGNILQGLPIPLEFDQLQTNNNKSIIAGNSMAFPSFPTSLPNNNNHLVLEGHPQASPSAFPGHQINKRLEHWSNAVSSSSSTLPPPGQNSNSLISHQFDASSSNYSIPFCDSTIPLNPALDHTNPRAFYRATDLDSNANVQPGVYYDSLQMRQSGNYGPTTDAMLSSNPKEGFTVGQQKLQSGFMGGEAGSLDDIVNSTMKQVWDDSASDIKDYYNDLWHVCI